MCARLGLPTSNERGIGKERGCERERERERGMPYTTEM